MTSKRTELSRNEEKERIKLLKANNRSYMKMGKGKGIWVDGNASEEELVKLQGLVREAIRRGQNGTLPMKFTDEKITFEAHIVKGNVVTFFGWNFPPKELWVKEDKDFEECLNCLPNGPRKEPKREVWCFKVGYNFPKCPYGVITKVTLIGG